MLQRDYILRLIREFYIALERALRNNEVEDRRQEIIKLCEKYAGPHDFLTSISIEELIAFTRNKGEDEQLLRLEIIAELFYAEADTVYNPLRDELLEKAFILYTLIDKKGRTYDAQRIQKMQHIKSLLSEVS